MQVGVMENEFLLRLFNEGRIQEYDQLVEIQNLRIDKDKAREELNPSANKKVSPQKEIPSVQSPAFVPS